MYFKMSSVTCFNLDLSKILSSGNGLKSFAEDLSNEIKMLRIVMEMVIYMLPAFLSSHNFVKNPLSNAR